MCKNAFIEIEMYKDKLFVKDYWNIDYEGDKIYKE